MIQTLRSTGPLASSSDSPARQREPRPPAKAPTRKERQAAHTLDLRALKKRKPKTDEAGISERMAWTYNPIEDCSSEEKSDTGAANPPGRGGDLTSFAPRYNPCYCGAKLMANDICFAGRQCPGQVLGHGNWASGLGFLQIMEPSRISSHYPLLALAELQNDLAPLGDYCNASPHDEASRAHRLRVRLPPSPRLFCCTQRDWKFHRATPCSHRASLPDRVRICHRLPPATRGRATGPPMLPLDEAPNAGEGISMYIYIYIYWRAGAPPNPRLEVGGASPPRP